MTIRRRAFLQVTALGSLAAVTFHPACASAQGIGMATLSGETLPQNSILRVHGWDAHGPDRYDAGAGTDAWIGINRGWRATWR